MRFPIDPVLVALTGSETRARTLGVLANAERPLTGYRIAKLAGLAETKVYRELARAAQAGLVKKEESGFLLVPSDLRNFLRVRFRVAWSEDWARTYDQRMERARARIREATSLPPLDYSKYRPNPAVARRYAREIERPAVKDDWPAGRRQGRVSRKRL